MKQILCSNCGSNKHYQTFCTWKKRKPIAKKGKRTIEYEAWRDIIARPYLIKKYGEVCAACGGARCGNKQLDVEHKKNRGSHPELKMVLSNVQLMGRFPCHYEKTNNLGGENSEDHD